MELFNSIFQFFTDNSKKISHKTILVLFSIFTILILDNFLSFTYYYNNEKKITQIESINKVIKDTTITTKERKMLFSLRDKIISHKTWKDNIWDFCTAIDFKNDIKLSPNINENKKNNDFKNFNKVERNYYIHYISSSWFFLLVILIVTFVGFSDKNTSFLTALMIILFFVIPLFLFLGWIFAKIFSFIPIILDNPVYNYILNFILSLLLIILFGFLIDRINKKRKDTI